MADFGLGPPKKNKIFSLFFKFFIQYKSMTYKEKKMNLKKIKKSACVFRKKTILYI
jgi:hypothetical protein